MELKEWLDSQEFYELMQTYRWADTHSRSTPEDTVAAFEAVKAAIQLAGVVEESLPTPAGDLGGCTACGHTVASHFRDGRWLGCLAGSEAVVYILVPVVRTMAQDRVAGRQIDATAIVAADGNGATGHRLAKVARYTSTLHHKADPGKLPLSDTRVKVLRVLHREGKRGLLARQIQTKAGLTHGAVQSTLAWLRAHDLVRASNADAGAGEVMTKV